MKRLRLLALVVGVALHFFAALLLLRGGPLALPILAHVAGSAAWGLGAVPLFPAALRAAWWFGGACALLFPVVGPLTSLALAAILRRPPVDHSARRYVVWNDQPVVESRDTLPAGAAGQSIVEILQSPRIQLRRNAVLALRELDPQLAVPLLRKGLQDSDEQVRIYAQNILSTMLERFETGLKELDQRLAAEPEAALHAIRLAEHYYELVYLDVAGDDDTAAHYLAKAQTLLARAAMLAPGDGQIPLLGLKCALRARDLAAAEHWFAQLEARGYDVPQVLPWHMELVFLRGDWPRLRELFTTFEHDRIVNPRIAELVQFWTPAPAAKVQS